MDDPYLLLAASLLPLAAAPWLARIADRSAAATAAVDSFVAVAVAGVVLLHVLPHAYLEAGLATLPAMAVGFVLPLGLGHGHDHGHGHSRRRERARSALILLAFLGLGLHATLDGLALFAPDGEHGDASGSLLAVAVVLHRLPMALAIWWIAAPSLGRRIAAGLLAAIGIATIAGFAVAGEVWGGLSSPGFAVLQTAIAGMLLHMVLGHHEHRTGDVPAPPVRLASTLGAIAGIVLVAALTRLHPLEHAFAGELSVATSFLTLVLAAAPALLLAYLGQGLLLAFAPEHVRSLLLVSRHPAAGDGEAPTAAGWRSVLVPEIQLPVLALSLSLLGAGVTAYRLLSVLAVGGLAVLSIRNLLLASSVGVPSDPLPREIRPRQLLWSGLRWGFGAEIERTMPWILVGLGIAALLEPMTDLAGILELAKPTQLGLMALLGAACYLLGLGSTPIAAVLLGKGLALGPLLVFLLAGTAAAGSRRLTASFGGRLGWRFAARMVVLALIWGYAFSLPAGAPDLHAMAAREPGAIAVASALVLFGLTLAALLRQGFRGFLRPSQSVERWHRAGL